MLSVCMKMAGILKTIILAECEKALKLRCWKGDKKPLCFTAVFYEIYSATRLLVIVVEAEPLNTVYES